MTPGRARMKVYRTRRDVAREMIAEVIRCCGRDCDLRFVRKAISATYPWGERKYWPYKVWCDETRRQLGLKRSKDFVPEQPDPRQLDLVTGGPA